MKTACLVLISFLFTISTFASGEPGNGTISGKVLDAKNGETLIGVSVYLEGTTTATSSDMDGNFSLSNITPGKCNVVFKYIGYQLIMERDVVVEAGKITTISLSMKEDQVNLNEVVVKADIVKRDNASAIVLMQKNSTIIQSGISSEEIKRTPDRNSGDVIKRLSGAVISEGKYAVIRGLADRYNIAMVNGMILPSTEPDRKTFAFDMFPSNMLDNIIVYKTAQPDLPSEFAGGIINMSTKDIPEKSFFQINYTNTFTQGSTFKPYMKYQGGKLDALGFDDGGRQLPNDFPTVDSMTAWNNFNPKKYAATKTLKNDWGAKKAATVMYPGQSVQASGGFANKLKKTEVGGVFAVNYSNNIRMQAIDNRQSIGTTDTDWVYNETRYINTTQLGALANLAVQYDGKHKISVKSFFNQGSENITANRHQKDYNTQDVFDREIYQFVSNTMASVQLTGDHFLKGPDIKIRWYGGYAYTHRDQPKTRGIAYRTYLDNSGDKDTMLRILSIANSPDAMQGGMFFADLRDKQYNGGFDFSLPFKMLKHKQSFKTGFYYLQKERAYDSRVFGYVAGPNFKPTHFFDTFENAFDTSNINKNGYILAEATNKKESYTASSQTTAAYAMFENKFTPWFRMVWGMRFEYFRQRLNSFDQTNNPANRDNKYYNFLPSTNLIFSLNEKSNFRASYSMTTSRPEFRELVDNAFFDFSTYYSVTGNPNLTQTKIHNADLRYEIFFGKGQMISASAFYKRLLSPIELLAQAGTGSVLSFQYNNKSKAHLAGGEIEIKKNFDFFGRWKQWENFSISVNVAYIYSKISITDSSIAGNQSRPLYGQAPYVVNASLQYNEPNINLTCNLLFNMSGPKIFAVSGVNNYDIYENARPQLDFQISKGFFKNKFLVRFTAGDLIANPTVRYYNNPKENKNFDGKKDEVFGIWRNYRTFALTFGYSF